VHMKRFLVSIKQIYHRYVEGAASSFNGADLIIESNHGVITVIVQYRLGLFGKYAFAAPYDSQFTRC
jgi:carboxylesterase type B